MTIDLDARAFVKRKGALWPRDPIAEEFVQRLPEGKEVLVTPRRARNPRHHRLFMAMLRKVVDNTDKRWPSERVLLDELKLITGLGETRISALTGERYLAPSSISFSAMKQDQFAEWFERALDVLLTRVLQTSRQTLIDEILEMAGEQRLVRSAA